MSRPLRVLELFCGIGGLSAALAAAIRRCPSGDDALSVVRVGAERLASAAPLPTAGALAEVVAAVDVNRQALASYAANFPHPLHPRTIESLPIDEFAAFEADLWWLSPPCQPHTQKGPRRDLADPRSEALQNVVRAIAALRPAFVALENVPGFIGSGAHVLVRRTLEGTGYRMRETLLCPSELGIPNRRLRFYLVASRAGWGEREPDGSAAGVSWSDEPLSRRGAAPPAAVPSASRVPGLLLREALAGELDETLVLPPELLDRYRGTIEVIDPRRDDAVAACFTSGYGHAHVRCGSFLAVDGRVRRFSPREVATLLGFAPSFAFPASISRRVAWRLLGNSLSVPAVRAVLRALPPLARLG